LAVVACAVVFGTVLLIAASGGSAAPPQTAPGNSGRDSVVSYWSAERVARAVPREVSPDRVPSFAPSRGAGGQAGKPGGGGGSTTTVTGSAWTGGGQVKQTTGKVLFTMDGVDYVCSGSVVQDTSTTTGLVLTAGHCVYDETNRAFATNWMFVPAYEDGGAIVTNPDGTHSFSCDIAPYGCWAATALVTTTAWATGAGSLAGFDNDYAFAVVGAGGKTGQSNQLDAAVGGANRIAFNQSHPTQVYAFGYPQASPYDGQKLIYCAGRDIADTWGGSTDYGLNCNMTGGSSGGPWFVKFGAADAALNSVNSFKYTVGKYAKYMFGPYFGPYAQKTYDTATTASSNTLVASP
jgi:hypothetical protein